jgi:hypothetical protein
MGRGKPDYGIIFVGVFGEALCYVPPGGAPTGTHRWVDIIENDLTLLYAQR